MERLTNADHKEMDLYAYCGEKNPYEIPLTIGELAGFPEAKYSPREILEEVFARLAAYEDTGIEPEDVSAQFDLLRKYSEAANGIGVKRLRELAQAEKDGRLVVLPFSGSSISEKALQQLAQADYDGRLIVPPCKIGDLLYEVDLSEYGVITCKVLSISYYNGPMFHVPENEVIGSLTVEVEVIEGHGKGSSYNFEIDDFGKTVFLTRQEAEEALREEDDNG